MPFHSQAHCSFYGVGGEQQMKAIIATLTNNPEFLEELRKELDGKVCSSVLLCKTEIC